MDLKGRKLGNYEIFRLIGEGGMGRVWEARHAQLARKAAVKALAPELAGNPQIAARFKNEAAIMASLDHPNIVRLYDYLEEETGKYLFLEYAEGQALDEHIKNVTGPMPEEKALSIFRQILEGARYAHEKGIVHRDFKPSNVMYDPESGRAKVLDFGIAKLLEQPEGDFRLTSTGMRVGTPLYMSPEQVRGQQPTPASDVYSLGMLLYAMLTARNPLSGLDTEFDIQEAIVRKPLPPMRDYYPGVSDRMQRVVDKATAKAPEDRYVDARAFLKGLETAGQDALQPPGLMDHVVGTGQETKSRPVESETVFRDANAKEPKKRGGGAKYAIIGVLLLALAAGAWYFMAGGSAERAPLDYSATADGWPMGFPEDYDKTPLAKKQSLGYRPNNLIHRPGYGNRSLGKAEVFVEGSKTKEHTVECCFPGDSGEYRSVFAFPALRDFAYSKDRKKTWATGLPISFLTEAASRSPNLPDNDRQTIDELIRYFPETNCSAEGKFPIVLEIAPFDEAQSIYIRFWAYKFKREEYQQKLMRILDKMSLPCRDESCNLIDMPVNKSCIEQAH